MKLRGKRTIGALLVVVLTVFCLGWVGLLDHEDQHMGGDWTFWASLIVKDDITVEDDLTVTDDSTFTSDVAVGGDLSVTGSIVLTDELVLEVYNHTSGMGALTWLTTMGNVLLTSGGTTTAIALPVGSAALDGYVLITKNIADAQARTFTANVNSGNPGDTIESTRGDGTGTTDATQDAAGDTKIWIYDYTGSTTSGVWRYLIADQA